MVRRLKIAGANAVCGASTRDIDLGTPVAGKETLTGWYWRELTSMDHGVIVEQLHYRMLVNRLLTGADQVATAVVLDQFYKNPQLPLPASEGVVARAIQLGVQDGALGLADLRDGEPEPESLRFRTPIALDAIDFSPHQVVLTRERAELVLAELEARRSAEQRAGAEHAKAQTVTDGGSSIGGDTVTTIRSGEDVPGSISVIIPLSEISDTDTAYHRLRLVIAGIPASKIADVNRGIFLPLSNLADGGLTFTLELDVTSEEGIPPRVLEQTIKETVRQIGARVVEEQKG